MGRVLKDMVGGGGFAPGDGRFKIDNYASLPDEFTKNFSTQTFGSTASYSAETDLINGHYFSIQAIITADSSVVGGELTIQGSNIGGDAEEVWVDVNTATAVADTDVGSSKIFSVSDKIKNFQYVRVKGATSSGTFTCYLIAYGLC